MRVKYSPPDIKNTYEGDIICTNIIDDEFYFLILLDDGTFKSAKTKHCKVVN